MEWFVIGRDMHVLCNPSTDSPGSLPIDDSGSNQGQTITLTNNVAIGTYDFTTYPDHEDSKYITEGNYIAFRDKYGKDRLYTIMTIDGDDEWDVHCEDIGLDLINEAAEPWNVSAESIATTLDRCLRDTGWTIGINEIVDRERATKYEGKTDSNLARIGMIMNTFEAECEFVIELNGAKVTKQVINIYKTLGEDKVQQRFIDDINLIALSRSGSIEDLCTCVICYGKEENDVVTTISDVEYDDGRYYSPKGHTRIYDREAHQKWSRFRAYDYAGQGEFDGYINGVFEYDTDSPQELFNRGLSDLKKRNEKKVSYEAELYDLQADIGDTIQIADNRRQEKVYLSARVQEVQNHYTVVGEDTGKLANYALMESKKTQAVEDMIKELQGKVVSIDHAEVSYQVGESGTEPPTGEWSSEPVSAEAGKYLWTRTITYYTNGSENTSYSVAQSGKDGANGKDGEKGEKGDAGPQGEKGEKGDTGPQGLQGLQGPQGEQGIPGPTGPSGKDGTNGKTSYFHLKYSAVANPTSASQMTETPNIYIGTYVDYTENDSNDPKKYTWYRFQGLQGEQGTQGIPGINGADGKTSYLHIKYSNDGGKTFTSNSGETVGDYIGQCTDFNKDDPTTVGVYTWSKIKGETGNTGTGIAKTVRYYMLQSSSSAAPSKPTANPPAGWSDTEPAYVSGSTNTLYFVDCNIYSDKTFSFSEVSKSSTYEAAKDAWNKANNAQESIDNLEIGGRNLLTNTWTMDSPWTNSSKAAAKFDETEKIYYRPVWSSTGSSWNNYVTQRVKLQPSTEYTLSFLAKRRSADVNPTLMCRLDRDTAIKYIVPASGVKLGTSWNRYSYTFTAPDNASNEPLRFYAYVGSGAYNEDTALLIANVKLEKGNKATDWTPAPEDAIAQVDVEYYLSDSATSLSGGSWTTLAPTWVDGKFMWSRTVTTDGVGNKAYSPNQNGVCIAGATGNTGATGKGIKSIVEQYYKSTSATLLTGGTWSATYPGWENGKYIWTRSVTTYTDNTTDITTPICVTGEKGTDGKDGFSPTVSVSKSENTTTISITDKTGTHTQTVKDGTNGTPGAPGSDGRTPYIHVKYSDDGGKTFTSNSGETVGDYIGQCTDFNANDPTNVSSYTWSKIKGEKGDIGPQGEKGEKGDKGDSGIIVSSIAPSSPTVGQLWQTASGQPIKRWNGSSWVLHYISVDNLDVATLSAITANIGTLTGNFESTLQLPSGGVDNVKGTTKIYEGLISGNYALTNVSNSIGSFESGFSGIKGNAARLGMGNYSYEYGYNGIHVTNGAKSADLPVDKLRKLDLFADAPYEWKLLKEVSNKGFGSVTIADGYHEFLLTVGPFKSGDTGLNNRVLASVIIPRIALVNTQGRSDADGMYQAFYNSSYWAGLNYTAANTIQIRASQAGAIARLWAR